MSALLHHVALVSDSPSVTFGDSATVAAALQKQATRDFAPLWQVNLTVDAFENLEAVPVDYWPVISPQPARVGVAPRKSTRHGSAAYSSITATPLELLDQTGI